MVERNGVFFFFDKERNGVFKSECDGMYIWKSYENLMLSLIIIPLDHIQ